MENPTENIVEILDSGDITFAGRLITSAEFLVGTVLCELSKVDGSNKESNIEKEQTLEDISDDNSVCSVEIRNVVRPVAPRKRKYEKLLQLPADDIRLTYAKEYLNALNSGDVEVYGEVLRNIAIPKVVMVSRKNIPDPNFLIPTHMEIVGVEAITHMVGYFFQAVPDMIIKQQSQRIHVFDNGESSIECFYRVSGSKVLEIDGVPAGSNEKIVYKTENEELNQIITRVGNMNPEAKIVANCETIGGETTTQRVSTGASHKSKVFSSPYTLTMHLNVNKKVFLIIFATD